MLELIQAPQNLPFIIALALVVLLAAGQVLMLLVGGMVSIGGSGVDADFDLDADIAPWSVALDWLGVGKLPFSVLFSLWATGFGLSGLTIQAIAKTQSGAFLPAITASGIALLVSLPFLKVGGLILKPLIPRDETEAVTLETLVGREAEIVVGIARRGRPTQARVSDEWGTTHYVLVEPENDEESFAAGSKVLLLKRVEPIFRVIGAASS